MKVIFISGKGGVGKSTVACVTALKAAESGARTLLVSTDQVHSLSDIFGRRIGPEMRQVAPGLEAIEVDATRALREYFAGVIDYTRDALEEAGLSQTDADEVAVFPGAAELACMMKVYHYYLTHSADVMVVDTASSSETVKLLKIPGVMKVFLSRLRASSSTLFDRFASVVEKIFSVHLPRSQLLERMLQIAEDLEAARDVFVDPDITRFRVVCTPERVVLRETERFASYISILGFPVEAIIVNRVKAGDSRRIGEIKNKFQPLQVFVISQRETEPCGMKHLADFTKKEREMPGADFLETYWNIVCEATPEGYVLKIPARGLRKEDLEIYADFDSLFIRAREVSREILLPQILIGARVKRAALKDHQLLIYFEHSGSDDGH